MTRKNTRTWQTIEDIARDMGVSYNTLRQWRLRGVPYWAHVKIIQASAGKVTAKQLMDTRQPSHPKQKASV